ncbi:DEKNAAC102003 [Brettanomyces naardenensis]|uniref:DEKNAAC102003 n=1 Tax=Brettanomyces naardenensis TaxID=13370 RepID=A0A448YJE1_BRENA|nr:DEKNAAC102003 [Brettanomyces naardenensis]
MASSKKVEDIELQEPFVAIREDRESSIPPKKPLFKRKLFWLILVPITFLLLAGGCIVEYQKSHIEELAPAAPAKMGPVIRRGTDSVNKDDSNGNDDWRLDSANYTMDLPKWRADYGETKERHYYFNVTQLVEVKANNAVRNLTVINGHYPGPLVEANSGDTIYLHVQNQLKNDPVSIHCHGMFYPENPFDDGAVSINNCPIPPGGSYTYKVPTSKNQSGTYWYHSHWGTQYADGVFGPLVLHSPDEDSKLDYYDTDRVLVINDYYHDDASTYLSDYLAPGNENSEPIPDDGLIDGVYSQSASYMVPSGFEAFNEALYFDPNSKHRLRVLNAGMFAPFLFSIDDHQLTIIEADGTLVEPKEEDSVALSVAQRYSFFIECKGDLGTNYWIHARFNSFCFTEPANFDTDVRSILSYTGVFTIPEDQQTWTYDGGNPNCLDYDQTKLKTLDQTVPLNSNGSSRPDVIVNLDVSFMIGAYQLDKAYFNQYTWQAFPNTSTMYESLFNDDFETTDVENYVEDQYILNFDKRGQIVDFVINNYDDGAHPLHLHGHKFWLIATSSTGTFSDDMYDDESNLNLKNPILRDDVNVAPYGYAVFRFVVENPGVWPFHCHIGWHMEAGLLLQIQELRSEFSQYTLPDGWKDACDYDFSE